MAEEAKKRIKESSSQTDDFFTTLKKMYQINEELWSRTWEHILTSESFADLLGITNKQAMFFLRLINENSTRMLSMGHLPSREDLANVSKQIIATEEKVDDVVFKLEDLSDLLTNNLMSEVEQLKEQFNEIKNYFIDSTDGSMANNNGDPVQRPGQEKSKRTRTAKKPAEEPSIFNSEENSNT